MQDHICQVDQTSCNARPDHTLGQTLPSLPARLKSGLAHEANIKGETQHVSEGHEETFHCVPHT